MERSRLQVSRVTVPQRLPLQVSHVQTRRLMVGYPFTSELSIRVSLEPRHLMLLTEGLAFGGAIHVGHEGARAAIELVHQLVPVRFQLFAVALTF